MKDTTLRGCTEQQLFSTYSAEHQAQLTSDREACFLGTAPTLGAVAQAFGEATARLWVSMHLHDLASFAGGSKITPQQIAATAEVIVAMHSRLKLTELMYFFLHLKGGEWGAYYGLGNGMQVTSALSQFLASRVAIIDSLERERTARREAAERGKRRGVTYDEYLQWRRDNGLGEPDCPWLKEGGAA